MRSPLAHPALFMPDVHARLNVALFSQEGNCVSTAFYLAGLIDDPTQGIDALYDRQRIASLLDRCTLLDGPLPGCLVAWHDRGHELTSPALIPIAHMGLVMTMAPLLVTHRPNYTRPLHEGESIESIDASESVYSLCAKRFYAPPQRT